MKKLRHFAVLATAVATLSVVSLATARAEIVGHWSFDDGTASDSAGTNNGSLEGGATTSSADTAAAFGGQALSLDNLTTQQQYVLVPHTDALAIGDNMTISYWLKSDASLLPATSFTRPLAKPNETGGWAFQRHPETGNTGEEMRIRIDTADADESYKNQTRPGNDDALTVFDGDWHHVLVTLSSGSGVYYFDGTGYGFSYTPGDGFANTNAMTFGRNGASGGDWMSGLLDDVAIWDTSVLTEGQAKGLHNVAVELGLGYDAGEADQLIELHKSGSGSTTVDGTAWFYVAGLTGNAGDLTAVDGGYVLQLDESSGVTTVPEPGTFVLLGAGLLTGLAWSRRRNRNNSITID